MAAKGRTLNKTPQPPQRRNKKKGRGEREKAGSANQKGEARTLSVADFLTVAN
jgi:hypothetical protein